MKSIRTYLGSATLLWFAISASALPIRIRVLDGHNGRPINGEQVSVAIQGQRDAMDYITDDQGDVTVDMPPSATFIPSTGWRVTCRNVNPTAPHWFSAQTVLNRGAVDENTCGKARSEQIKGTLTIFTRKATLLENLKR